MVVAFKAIPVSEFCMPQTHQDRETTEKGRTTVSPNHKHMTGTRYQFRKDTDRI
ncbi:predicted protein [Botrytis cinerea T4]|uniref:Uncharacterized protein n=1 Tax=Botryotinia fuckeliana (strain T4) TaxID=999810 RepID=G2XWF1_BOTF4|nr:predicted protein [Botrytis cinerea T4]